MQREMIHTDAFLGMMPVRDHRKFKIDVHNAIVEVEQKLDLPYPGEKKEVSGYKDPDLTAASVLNLITELTTKVKDYLSTQQYAMHVEMNKRNIAFADATVKLHEQWKSSSPSITPGPRG